MEVPTIFLNRILSETAKSGASSLHLSAGSVPMIRIDGELMPMEKEELLSPDIIKKLVDSFIEDGEREILEKEKEVVLVRVFGNNLRFRINIFYQKDLLSISFNYVSGFIRPWAELGFLTKVQNLVQKKTGLLIIAGPNDSGRTSTAVSFIEEINKASKRYIITLEKPIEYLFINKKSIIEQRQIGRDVKTYKDGLMHCLDEDVDLVYIDEVFREFDDIMPFVLELASGNCLVVLEMNAENATRAIERIFNYDSTEATRYNLADVLIGVLAQKLLPRVGEGMVLAPEVMLVNSAIRSLIREGNIYRIDSIIQTSREDGMISMDKSIEELVANDMISKENLENLKDF